ncbi:L,D-transpeptidase family protein [Sphingomonas sp. So64.6b]|uniref:L,D-transpeptidase family protein n=1 Tax=Sphingomonas sp. So64.6b TaxID=2997354 RepID=UPI00185F3C96|nr:L,D-transpeptidase family protein [Sphingomonas sp. So64.6b]QNA82687.1 L,D-transpeptidase family protein [Sphingomonas sp. So64.6b]
MRPRRIPHGFVPHYLMIALAVAGAGWSPAAAAPARDNKSIARSGPAARGDAIALAIQDKVGGSLKRFYAERRFRPLWASGGKIGRPADTLIGFLRSAGLDRLKPSSYDIDDLRETIAAARGGDPRAVARAELALSATFARYVRDQRGSGVRMIYADRALKPKPPKPETVLRAAAFPKSLDDYVTGMGWMSPHYVRLRQLMARAEKAGTSKETMKRLELNLDRARLLPGPWTRHVVVDASSGRLWYYQGGEQVGTMRVVVGAEETQTPMLVGNLQWAILNPYWNVPTYLARQSIAPKVLSGHSLASQRIEALSDWSASARPLSAASIDWAAVASGKREIRLRELPGGANSMGRVKFLFPNKEGIYLHDTPNRDLLEKDDRHFSNGCIRLENAAELGRWLLQKPIRAGSTRPEQAVPLPVQVPVYLTYLTATATERGVAFRRDIYGRDG